MENTTTPPKKNRLKIILIVVVAMAGLWFVVGGGSEEQAKKEMNEIENQVAQDAVKEYEIVKKNGSAMDAYVQAGMVAAAFLQAKDEENYKKWKAIEKKEARAAGMDE